MFDELLDWLRIPSISALPEHVADVQRAAEWAAARLRAIGIEKVQIMPTGGHPVVYGEWLHAPGQPIVMIYGHFDTQPVDPLDLWDHPPFEPFVEGDRVYARGATDDKGNALLAIPRCRGVAQDRGQVPVNVKFFWRAGRDWQPATARFCGCPARFAQMRPDLGADGGQYSETEPALLVGLRGICALQLDVRGPSRDLHSGTYGGRRTEPHPRSSAPARFDAQPRRRGDGGGFYDDVAPLTAEERARMAAVPFDEVAYKAEIGVEALFGEPGYTPCERTWARPTLELNGIWGGFQGEGSKTVLPSEAHAKITCRLVPNQDPHKIVQAITAHVTKHTPIGVRVNVRSLEAGARP
jgi:acetylornithine deacetylase/succinyl-diaminopimelate desuccinylase-like protein